ncbi:FtsX-like permease family protein [Actinocorallia longicatena]
MLVLAASLTVLFALVMLATLTAYTSTVTREGLARTLGSASFDQVGTRIGKQVGPGGFAGDQAFLEQRLRAAYRDVPLEIGASARGESFSLPGQEKLSHPELTTFAMFSGIDRHASLAEGAWPVESAGGPVQAVLPVPAARLMKAEVGDTLRVVNRLDHSPVSVTVVGLFTVGSADDPFWSRERLAVEGVERLDYTTIGPLVVDPATFGRLFSPRGVQARWTVLPSAENLDASGLHALAGRLDRLAEELRGREYSSVSGLAAELRQLDTALLVTRSTMLVPVLQLIVLAGYALLLVARLISEQRRAEVSLLRARGASLRQVAGLALGEGLVLAVPGLVAAPLLAPWLLRLAAASPALGATGLELRDPPAVSTWVVTAVAALACAVALAVPTVRSAKGTYVASQAGRGRGEARGPLQKAGADLALLVVAGLGVWQLTRYGSTVTSSGGGLGVDPVIVAGPALALLAGGVLVLRLVPAVSGLAERVAAGGRGLAPALGARQISRRPLRYAGPALLLVMAVAVGILSVTTSGTWRASQRAQADFQAGADVRVAAPVSPALPSVLGQGGVLASSGASGVGAVSRTQIRIGDAGAAFLAVDAVALGKIVVGEAGAGRALTGPAAGRPAVAGALPGTPRWVEFTVVASGASAFWVREVPEHFPLSVTLVDGAGLVHVAEVGSVPADGRRRTVRVDLAALAGPGGRPTYPYSVRSFGYSFPEEVIDSSAMELRVERVVADGREARLEEASRWRALFSGELNKGRESVAVSGGGLVLRVPFGDRPTEAPGRFRPPAVARAVLPGPSEPLAGVITVPLAERKGLKAGDTVALSVAGTEVKMKVAAVVRAFPATAPGEPAVLVDLASLNERAVTAGVGAMAPSEWWMSGRVRVAELSGWGEVHDRLALRREYRDSPLGAALQGALFLGFLAALAFAVIGFAINATVSARERTTEFAVLRALGASHRQVFGMLAVEQAVLVLLGLAGGLGLGLGVAALAVPHLVLTVRATVPYPQVDLVVAWGPVLALLGGTLAVLALVLTALVARLRRAGSGALTRMGADA